MYSIVKHSEGLLGGTYIPAPFKIVLQRKGLPEPEKEIRKGGG